MKMFPGLLILSSAFFSLQVLGQVTASPLPVPSPSAVAQAGGLLSWLQTNGAMLFAVLFGFSETLALIPQIKANSVFQMVFNALSAASKIINPPAN